MRFKWVTLLIVLTVISLSGVVGFLYWQSLQEPIIQVENDHTYDLKDRLFKGIESGGDFKKMKVSIIDVAETDIFSYPQTIETADFSYLIKIIPEDEVLTLTLGFLPGHEPDLDTRDMLITTNSRSLLKTALEVKKGTEVSNYDEEVSKIFLKHLETEFNDWSR